MTATLVFQDRSSPGAELDAGVARAANALRRLGIGADDVVALMMRNSPLLLELVLAARHLGARWCPVNWHFKAEELQYILHDSGARLLVADDELLQGLAALDAGTTQVIAARPDWVARRDAESADAPPPVAPRGAMFYTSGTTGRPKGIRRAASTPEQVALAQQVGALAYGIEPGMRALVSAPMYHSAPNAYSIGAALSGALLVIEPRFDAERTLQLIERHRLTHAYLVPTMYVRLLALPEAVRARHDLSSMRFVASTGSPCPPPVKRAMIEWWGPVIHESYGSSELGYMTVLTSADALARPGSAGRALPGVQIAILDEHGRELPRGQAGLIYAHQPAYADFTYNHNDDARRRMEVGGLKTMGDIGYLDDDGFLFIVDRAADMVISGGVNVYPAEIEAVLHGMPGVADCAVFGIPDDEFGEALAAAVQSSPGVVLDTAAVQAYLREHLAGYKVPRLVTFHDSLPREDTGKIFKRRLRDPYWAGRERKV